MLERFAADLVLLLHFAFIVFVMLGGLLVLRWRALAILHVPAVVWAAWAELTGTICPLTFVENRLRIAAGASGYSGSFVEHYLLGVIYPAWVSRPTQFALAALVVVVNAAIYLALMRSRRAR